MLHAKGPVEVVILGSSRSNDGLAPSKLGFTRGFTVATPSTSLQTLEFIATHVGQQKLALVELSKPMFVDKPMDDVTVKSTRDTENDPLGAWLADHSALLGVRRAFALENLPRVVALLSASRLDGSEFFRSRQITQTFASTDAPPGISDDAAWVPSRAEATDAPHLDEESERIVSGYTRTVKALRDSGAKVILIAPPLGAGWRAEECTDEKKTLRLQVALRVHAPFIDFTCGEVDERWFLEGQHLGAPGRARFTRALSEALHGLP